MQPAQARMWKTIVFSGIFSGILLALIQLAMLGLGTPHFGLGPVILLALLCYVAGPGLAAFLVTYQTKLRRAGYSTGVITGTLCAAILFAAFTIYVLNPPIEPQPITPGRFPAPGKVIGEGIMFAYYMLLSGLTIVGGMLSLPGAFLGSLLAAKK